MSDKEGLVGSVNNDCSWCNKYKMHAYVDIKTSSGSTKARYLPVKYCPVCGRRINNRK